ncbi:MAG: hypothetical protein ACQ5SW_01470 [Sphaerochaetaceae bacterium]
METEKKQTSGQGRQKRRNRSKKQTKAKGPSKDKAKKNGSSKQSLLPEQHRKSYHSNLPQLPVKKVHEPKEKCVICGEAIEGIASALTHPDGGFCHFDCVLNQIKEEEKLTSSQKVSYIGRGTFAVVSQEENGSFSFVKKVVWETSEAFAKMKQYVEAQKK